MTRLEELLDFTEQVYGADSHGLTLILSSLLLPYPGTNPCWLVVDTQKSLFWEHFEQAIAPYSGPIVQMHLMRKKRPKYGNGVIEEALANRQKRRLFMDVNWKERVGHRLVNLSRYTELTSECLRVRMPVAAARIPPVGSQDRLTALIRGVIADEHRKLRPVPWSDHPEMFKTACELVFRSNPELEVAQRVLENAGLLLTSHMALHDRKELTVSDHMAIRDVLLTTIRPWSFAILDALDCHDGYHTILSMRSWTNLPMDVLGHALKDLTEGGLVEWRGRHRPFTPKVDRFLPGIRPTWVGPSTERGPDALELVGGRMEWW